MANTPSIRRSPKQFDISSIDDLLDAAGITDGILPIAPDGIRRLPFIESGSYWIHETFEWPRMLMPKQTNFFRFEPIDIKGPRTAVRIEFDGASGIHTGGDADTPMIWGRDVGSIRFDSVGYHDIGAADVGHVSTFADLVGASGFSLFGTSFLPAEQFKRIATLVDMTLEFRPHAVSDNQEGYVTRQNPTSIFPSNLAHSISGTRFTQPNNKGTTAPMLVFQGSPVNTVCGINSVDQQSGDSFLAIDSAAAANEYVFSAIPYSGVNGDDFFRPNISEALSLFADSFISIDSFQDAPAPNAGVNTQVNFTSIQKFTRGQNIRIGGATQVTLNGAHQIQKVADDQSSFEIPIVFVTDSSAIVEITTVTVVAATHGMVEGETQTISGTTSYNQTSEILFISSDRKSFDIPVVFVGAEPTTGTVVSTSKTQASFGVTVSECGAQADSKTLGTAASNAESTTTTPADGTYAATNFGTLTEGSVSERVTLTTAAQGVFTYNGENPATLKISGPLNGVKSGANRNYRFSPSVDGAIPVFASAEYAPFTITSVNSNIYFSFFVDVNPGETIQLMSAGDGTTDAFTITDTLLSIEEV